ncbi:MAG TPA: hypothetical protein VIL29_06515, partial [Pseudothermotoga sp.]
MRISVMVGAILLIATCLFANIVLINDPGFVKLTAVQNFSHNLWWATDYVLEIQALNRNMPVEVSY